MRGMSFTLALEDRGMGSVQWLDIPVLGRVISLVQADALISAWLGFFGFAAILSEVSTSLNTSGFFCCTDCAVQTPGSERTHMRPAWLSCYTAGFHI